MYRILNRFFFKKKKLDLRESTSFGGLMRVADSSDQQGNGVEEP